jgi:GTPase SAR1 family protein
MKVSNWVNLIYENAEPDIILFLVGAKGDLALQRTVTIDMIDEYLTQQQINPKGQAIISSKTGLGVDKLFEDLTKLLVEQKKQESIVSSFPIKNPGKRLSVKVCKSPKDDKCTC